MNANKRKIIFWVLFIIIFIISCLFLAYTIYECRDYWLFFNYFKEHIDIVPEDLNSYLAYKKLFIIHLLFIIFQTIILGFLCVIGYKFYILDFEQLKSAVTNYKDKRKRRKIKKLNDKIDKLN